MNITATTNPDIAFGTALMSDSRSIFVFGSNMNGSHGGGAAAQAAVMYGAENGVGKGITGRTYAFPTLDKGMRQLSPEALTVEVVDFVACVLANPDKVFILTSVGTGIAGLDVAEVAEYFKDVPEDGIIFPQKFLDALNLDRSDFEKRFIAEVSGAMGQDWMKQGATLFNEGMTYRPSMVRSHAQADTLFDFGSDAEFDTEGLEDPTNAFAYIGRIGKAYAELMADLKISNPEAYVKVDERLSDIVGEAVNFAYEEE